MGEDYPGTTWCAATLMAAYQLWMCSFGNTPIRWFPGNWSPKERKNCEQFRLVWRNSLEGGSSTYPMPGQPGRQLIRYVGTSFDIHIIGLVENLLGPNRIGQATSRLIPLRELIETFSDKSLLQMTFMTIRQN
ncbi:hypothetical protein RCL_jg27414.t1 [Rhizophagus clarus]|uniref:Uncharacterized protein n=1 Tax=Rhizophagus clarus TaxID=94130 RepID=A0A8H3LX16_9GLOM|nr:hypothetical protein RCL_jg27414.t1 [Rhizophagus clarus]